LLNGVGQDPATATLTKSMAAPLWSVSGRVRGKA